MEYSNGIKQLLLFIREEWILLFLLTTIFVLYFYFTRNFQHFEKKGIKFIPPTIIFGNLGPRFLAKKSFHDFHLEIYNYFKGNQFGGFFEGNRPVLYLLDPELIKIITIRDFEYFVDRNSLKTRDPMYLQRSLLNLKGSEWKGVRGTITPSFSSIRLKAMLPIIELCSQQMVEFLKKFDNQEVEMKEKMGHFTLEVIGACAFGIKCDAINENAHFLNVAKKFNHMSITKRVIFLLILMLAPKMLQFVNVSFMNRESTDELVKVLKKAKAERRLSNDRKNDFLQLLIDAAEIERSESNDSKTYLDDDTIDAQSLLFILAGYETSSTLLSFAIYTLATKPNIQEKLRNHIEETCSGKDLSYELLSELSYLEGFLLETLRMYPPLALVDRRCTKKYIVPGTSVELDVGDTVTIPIYGIHMDPDYYPNPQEFLPERFMGEEKKNRPSHLFLAFGAGPRNCIGLRFAMYSAKLAMVSLLKNFKFSVCSKTEIPVKFHKRSILLNSESGLWVRIENIQ